MTDQKTIAKALDIAASRSSNPASGKQCWFLAKLMLDTGNAEREIEGWGYSYANSTAALSKKQASFMIDQYLN